MEEVQAELEADAIDEWRCGGRAKRRRIERRHAVAKLRLGLLLRWRVSARVRREAGGRGEVGGDSARARGPQLPRAGRRRHAADTRRARSAVVASAAGERAGEGGARLGWAEVEAGHARESAGAGAEQAGPASALGPERRRRPDKAEKFLFLF
jgi:hypothetical protein